MKRLCRYLTCIKDVSKWTTSMDLEQFRLSDYGQFTASLTISLFSHKMNNFYSILNLASNTAYFNLSFFPSSSPRTHYPKLGIYEYIHISCNHIQYVSKNLLCVFKTNINDF